jgi:hypothetical protein
MRLPARRHSPLLRRCCARYFNAAAPSLRDDDASIRNFGSLDMLGGKGLLV